MSFEFRNKNTINSPAAEGMAKTKLKQRDTAVSSQKDISAFHHDQPLFASATLSLDSWHVRIADPSNSTIRNEYTFDRGQVCKCLAWGSRPSNHEKKKRKVETAVLGVGLNDGSINLFVAAEAESIGKLVGHTGEVNAIAFTETTIWSAGSDGQAIEWDYSKKLRTLSIDSTLSAIAFHGSTLLAASYTIHRYPDEKAFTNHTTPVHSLVFVGNKFVSAADDDRYMNVYSDEAERALIAETDVKRIDANENVLCAVTLEGIELFEHPTSPVEKQRRKSQVMTAKSKIVIQRPDGAKVDIMNASIRTNQLYIAWNEGARMVFEIIDLYQNEQLIESTQLVREKQPVMGAANGIKEKTKKPYTDGNAQIGAGNDVADLESEEEIEEPTLAERLHAMEVAAPKPVKVVNMPPAASLTTVLTQALKSSDTALLESCLHHTDAKIILGTIRRLDSTLAVSLLEQLASRLSRKPGRSADLGVWVRNTIVVHGGYLASIPSLVRTLSSLHTVLSTRAATLPRLLALQGRLDMINAQIELRREGGQITGEDPSDIEYNEGESDISDEEVGIDDDVESEFSDGSEENEFAELDAQMEVMQSDDEESVESVASDDDA